jgi:hypothetical protein
VDSGDDVDEVAFSVKNSLCFSNKFFVLSISSLPISLIFSETFLSCSCLCLRSFFPNFLNFFCVDAKLAETVDNENILFILTYSLLTFLSSPKSFIFSSNSRRSPGDSIGVPFAIASISGPESWIEFILKSTNAFMVIGTSGFMIS